MLATAAFIWRWFPMNEKDPQNNTPANPGTVANPGTCCPAAFSVSFLPYKEAHMADGWHRSMARIESWADPLEPWSWPARIPAGSPR